MIANMKMWIMLCTETVVLKVTQKYGVNVVFLAQCSVHTVDSVSANKLRVY